MMLQRVALAPAPAGIVQEDMRAMDVGIDADHWQAGAGSSLYLSVIVGAGSTAPRLEEVLLGYLLQEHRDFELIVADDGSDARTRDMIASFEARAPFPVRHVRGEDNGPGRCGVLGKAIAQAGYDYVVLTDGDCVPRRDLLQVHASHAREGAFLVGGCWSLGADLGWKVGPEEIASGACFDPAWLRRQGRLGLLRRLQLGAGPRVARLMDRLNLARAGFDCRNISAWKADLLSVMEAGPPAKAGRAGPGIGERLVERGVGGIQVRYRALCLQLGPEDRT